ncbi:CapA family protein [Acetatifactor muris]|uniref:Capsule biosynthesis protein CapA n=1 Tax=Acetatifactor muris TaxID=879566 RepID=A0A2K4ZEK0_9FIRM|nr:CapA family protein [Acetatifactor muris]MCI8799039.1 CapA family protein [Lachnospiraceae bacterium]MCR2048499.1 CapA family protein [Acetatifactor muris]SOY28891.1 Capsule biosynthesis protein CapA [Acetatifactor muris]
MENIVKLLFVGDTFIDNEKDSILEDILKETLQNCDVVCCNFEAPVKTELQKAAKEPGVKLSQPSRTVEILKQNGFNLFALANNHIMNYGLNGLKGTLNAINRLGIHFIGAGLTYEEAYRPFIFEKHGVRIGIINAAECQYGTIEQNFGQGGHAWIFSPQIYSAVLNLKQKCDRVILVCHAGLENVELPLPEWRQAYKNFIDIGVDIVIGHHPHVVQGWEKYREGVIFYSLGNFIWDSDRVSSSQDPAIAVLLKMNGEAVEYEIIQIKRVNNQIVITKEKVFREYLNEICMILTKRYEYEHRINEICIQEYGRVYSKKIYELIRLSEGSKLKHYLWNIYMIVFKKNKVDEDLLYLWCADETLRWVIRRALIYKEKMQETEDE